MPPSPPAPAGYPIPASQLNATSEEGSIPWATRMITRIVSLGLEDGQPYVQLERPLTFNVSTEWSPRLSVYKPNVTNAGVQGRQTTPRKWTRTLRPRTRAPARRTCGRGCGCGMVVNSTLSQAI